MASTLTSRELAQGLLQSCLDGTPPDEAFIDELAGRALSADDETSHFAGRALFNGLIEPLADRFEPALCDVYADVFARILKHREFDPEALIRRYREVRQTRKIQREPSVVYVLSRVTLGADVAVTSLVLDAAKQRFPKASIVFAGPDKAWQLFEKDPRLRHLPVSYGRSGRLAERLSAYPILQRAFADPDSIVLDPDSRLTQLGLLPVCPAPNHYLFESRSFGGHSDATLPELTLRWLQATLGIEEAVPYLSPKIHFDLGSQPVIAISLGVGENPAKRVPDPFESEMLRHVSSLGAVVMVDRGAGGEEAERVARAIQTCGAAIATHDGSFASFASLIARSSLYVGYDSAGQHVAAAMGVPLVTVFAGYVSERMFQRWYPDGPGRRTVIRVSSQPVDVLLEELRTAARL